MLLPPHSDVDMSIASSTAALVFEISDSLLKEACGRICTQYDFNYDLLVQDRLLCAPKAPGLSDVIGKINTTLCSGGKNEKYILDVYAQEMVYNLLHIKGVRQLLDDKQQNPVTNAIRIMKEKCTSSVSIGDIAEDCGMSEPNFCQYFKKVTGVSPKEYLTQFKNGKSPGDACKHHRH